MEAVATSTLIPPNEKGWIQLVGSLIVPNVFHLPWTFPPTRTTLGSQSHILFPVCNNNIDPDTHVKAFTNIAEANMITNDAQHKQIFGTTLRGT